MVESRYVEATWVTYREAMRLFLRGATVATATRIALVVGTWLSRVLWFVTGVADLALGMCALGGLRLRNGEV